MDNSINRVASLLKNNARMSSLIVSFNIRYGYGLIHVGLIFLGFLQSNGLTHDLISLIIKTGKT